MATTSWTHITQFLTSFVLQLASQGHNFMLLLSLQEAASRRVLEQKLSGNLQILFYPGDPAYVPLRSWVAARDPLAARDPAKVQPPVSGPCGAGANLSVLTPHAAGGHLAHAA